MDSTWGQLFLPPTPAPSNPPLAIEDGNPARDPAPLLAIEDGDPHGADVQASLVSVTVEPFDPYLGAWSSDEDGEGDDDVAPLAPPQQVSVETVVLRTFPLKIASWQAPARSQVPPRLLKRLPLVWHVLRS